MGAGAGSVKASASRGQHLGAAAPAPPLARAAATHQTPKAAKTAAMSRRVHIWPLPAGSMSMSGLNMPVKVLSTQKFGMIQTE